MWQVVTTSENTDLDNSQHIRYGRKQSTVWNFYDLVLSSVVGMHRDTPDQACWGLPGNLDFNSLRPCQTSEQ